MKRKVGVFNTSDDAIAAIRRLQNLGYTNEEISVISRDETMKEFVSQESMTDEAASATATGAMTGGLIGGLGALLIELGLIAIPGIGPFLAVGPVGAALVGALTGGAVGGLVGALVELGFDETEAKAYDEQIQQGKILVMVDDHVDRTVDLDAILHGPATIESPVRSDRLDDVDTIYQETLERDHKPLSDDYLEATRRDHMGGGAPVQPPIGDTTVQTDYIEATRRDHMPNFETPDVLAGKWDQLKGHIQRQWGKLTNDDLDVIRGDRNILRGKLKDYYGYDDHEVDRQLDDYLDKL